jgi:hypothetical protein
LFLNYALELPRFDGHLNRPTLSGIGGEDGSHKQALQRGV